MKISCQRFAYKLHEKYLHSKEETNIEDKEDIEDVKIVNKTTDQAGTWKKGTFFYCRRLCGMELMKKDFKRNSSKGTKFSWNLH